VLVVNGGDRKVIFDSCGRVVGLELEWHTLKTVAERPLEFRVMGFEPFGESR
jgi:hypothetical protein